MENHKFLWENPLLLWPFSIAMLNYQRVKCPKEILIYCIWVYEILKKTSLVGPLVHQLCSILKYLKWAYEDHCMKSKSGDFTMNRCVMLKVGMGP